MEQDRARDFLAMKREVLEKEIRYSADADRWQKRTPEIIQLGTLKQMMDRNQENELIAASRAASDQKIYDQLLRRYGSF